MPNPLVIAWRWRYEITLTSGVTVGLIAVIAAGKTVPTSAAVIVITFTIVGWPTARRFVADRAWCIITPHRVRVACVEGLIYSRRGKIPIILWTSHQTFGERVLLWCRAGTSVDDFASTHATLAAACWAQEVAVYVDVHRTHLVSLDIIRRPSGNLTSDFEGHHSVDASDWPPA